MISFSRKAGNVAKGAAIGFLSTLALPVICLAGAPDVLDSAQLDSVTAGYALAVVRVSGQASGVSSSSSSSASTSTHYLNARGSGSALAAGTSSSVASGTGTVSAGTASATVSGSAQASGDSTARVVVVENARDGRVVDIARAIIVSNASGTDPQASTAGEGGLVTTFSYGRGDTAISITRVLTISFN